MLKGNFDLLKLKINELSNSKKGLRYYSVIVLTQAFQLYRLLSYQLDDNHSIRIIMVFLEQTF